jgi:hypothetical protein
MQRHRHLEFIRFLNGLERKVAADKPIHVVLDNYATHKHPKVLAWLARHPRWTFHFTPTSASWLNAVENFFSKMTRQAHPPRRLPLGRRPADGHQCLSRRAQCQPQAVCLDQIRRGHPGQTRPLPCTIRLIQCTSTLSRALCY